MHNKDMLFPDDMAPATKGDIRILREDMATKGDLSGFATKKDLAGFATKKDLAGFATKEDLARFPTKADLIREIAVSSTRLEIKMDAWAERIEGNNDRFRSEVMTSIDKFFAKVEGVSNGEKIMVHRVEGLESRVSSLEARQKD